MKNDWLQRISLVIALIATSSVFGQDGAAVQPAANDPQAVETQSSAATDLDEKANEFVQRLDRQVDEEELATKNIFDAVDLNNDGQIDEEERDQAKRVHEKLLETFDGNKDGQLDKLELRRAHESQKKPSPEMAVLQKLFESVDLNGDGILNEEEMKHAQRLQEQILKHFDGNGDGKLDRQEAQAVQEARRAVQQNFAKDDVRTDKADRNHDGQVGTKENAAAKRKGNRADRNEKAGAKKTGGANKSADTKAPEPKLKQNSANPGKD